MTLCRSVGQLDGSRNMAVIQLIQCSNQWKMSLDRRNIVPFRNIGSKNQMPLLEFLPEAH